MAILNNFRSMLSVYKGPVMPKVERSFSAAGKVELESAPEEEAITTAAVESEAAVPAAEAAEPIKGEARENVFVTPASLATFSGASGVIIIIWKFSQALFPQSDFPKSLIMPTLVSFVIGFFLLIMDLTDDETGKLGARTIIQKSVIAIINSILLASSAIGVDSSMLGGSNGTN
jgi:hypothetical protein